MGEPKKAIKLEWPKTNLGNCSWSEGRRRREKSKKGREEEDEEKEEDEPLKSLKMLRNKRVLIENWKSWVQGRNSTVDRIIERNGKEKQKETKIRLTLESAFALWV